MVMNGAGTRDTGRVLEVSKDVDFRAVKPGFASILCVYSDMTKLQTP